MEEVKAMQAAGERFIVGYTLTVPAYHFRKVLSDHRQSWVRMDKFSYIRRWDACPDTDRTSCFQPFYVGRTVQEVNDRIWNWLMTADKSGRVVELSEFNGKKVYWFDRDFEKAMGGFRPPAPIDVIEVGLP